MPSFKISENYKKQCCVCGEIDNYEYYDNKDMWKCGRCGFYVTEDEAQCVGEGYKAINGVMEELDIRKARCRNKFKEMDDL
jgi:hypothetical protein